MKGKRQHQKRERLTFNGEHTIRLSELDARRMIQIAVRRQTPELSLLNLDELPRGTTVCVFGHRMETALNNVSAVLRRQPMQGVTGRLQLMITGTSLQDIQRITGADYGEFGGIAEFSGRTWHDLTLKQGRMEVQIMLCEDVIHEAEAIAGMIDVPQERVIGLLDQDLDLSWIVNCRSNSWLSSPVMVTTTPARVLNHHEDGEYVDEPLLRLAQDMESSDPHGTILIVEGQVYTQAQWDTYLASVQQARQAHEEALQAEDEALARQGSWRYSYFTMTRAERAAPRARRSRGTFIAENSGEIRQREAAERLARMERALADLTLDFDDTVVAEPGQDSEGSQDSRLALLSLI